MIRLFRRATGQDRPPQTAPSAFQWAVNRQNMSSVYRRVMWLVAHPDVDEEDKGYLRGVAGCIDGAAVSYKYGQLREGDDGLKTAAGWWQRYGPKYERQAYPDNFPDDPPDGLGVKEINGTSLQDLRTTDPLFLYSYTMDLMQSGEYPEDANKWLERARSQFLAANRPPRVWEGQTGMNLDVGVTMLIHAERCRLRMSPL